MKGQTAIRKNSNKPAKRLDLQGIRGIAIIVVLGFHFYPQYMPNGYLGVDQFFVLSGFLMCMLLKRSEKQTVCSLIGLFYYKRLKRILPLYLLVIFLSLIGLYIVFPSTAIETNRQSAVHALLFVSNRPATDENDYFAMLEIAVDIFTHTWSLSVEVQFYFLVPFIFLFGNLLPSKLQYLYYGFLACSSYLLFYFSPPSKAFYSVFARTWQFIIGMVVYLLTISTKPNFDKLPQNEQEAKNPETTKKDIEELEWFLKRLTNFCKLSYLLLIFLTTIIMFPLSLKETTVRPLVTISTGILMLISQDNKILTNIFLTYFGDISYSLYLIHWPVYAYWKLTAEGNQFELFKSLLASICLAVIAFDHFEKWYLNLSSKNIGFLVVFLYLSNFIITSLGEIDEQDHNIYQRNFTRLDSITPNMTTDDAETWNKHWNNYDREQSLINPDCRNKNNATFGWCHHTNLPIFGKYKIAIVGNSWTLMHSKIFHQECGYKAKSILQGAVMACEPLYPTLNKPNCSMNFPQFEKRIREEKPDYVFILARHFTVGYPFENNETNVGEDPIYQVMLNQTLKILESVQLKLFVLNAIPQIEPKSVDKIVPMLKKGVDLVEIDKILTITSTYENARIRHAQLMKDCGERCGLIDYKPIFYNNVTGTFRYFDRKGFSYFTTVNHMNPHGFEKIREYWRNFCQKL